MLLFLLIASLIHCNENLSINDNRPALFQGTMIDACKKAFNHPEIVDQSLYFLEPAIQKEFNEFFEKKLLDYIYENDELQKIKSRLKAGFTNPHLFFKQFLNNATMSVWTRYYDDTSYGRTKTGCCLVTSTGIHQLSNEGTIKIAENDTTIFYTTEKGLFSLSKETYQSQFLLNTSYINRLRYNKTLNLLYLTSDHSITFLKSNENVTIFVKETSYPRSYNRILNTDFYLIQTGHKGSFVFNEISKEIEPLTSCSESKKSLFSESGKTLCVHDNGFMLHVYRVLPQSPFVQKIVTPLPYHVYAFNFLPNSDTLIALNYQIPGKRGSGHRVCIYDIENQCERLTLLLTHSVKKFNFIDNKMCCTSHSGRGTLVIDYETLLGYQLIKKAMNNDFCIKPIILGNE